MTIWPPSSSDGGEKPSSAFGRLHPNVQRWIWSQGWGELRSVQEQAIAPVLEGDRDVLIAAPTAGGKTEAAFLPLLSRVLFDTAPHGVRILCVSPLKALINDQFARLELLCETLDIPVHRWHGDVASSHKRRLLADPAGVLLITPESLEALFVLRATSLSTLFAGLESTVVDELHVFMGSERGKQLQSLLSRVELAVRRRVPRIGLSATLGDMQLAAGFLRPGGELPCQTLVASEHSHEVRLQVRGYCVPPPPKPATDHTTVSHEVPGLRLVAEHLFENLRGHDNLIFANSRQRVELLADRLRQISEAAHVPNEFWPHHGSLALELREHAEQSLKDPAVPASVVCTTTLEMGIDIGTVESVAQIGAPPSVASMRQRLGRSGRRGQPSILRMYIMEEEVETDSPPQDHLRVELVQSIAMVQLLITGWCEPPRTGALHLSTLVQQLLSLIAQHGGCTAADAWRTLCKDGAFRAVDTSTFSALLRDLASHELVMQARDQTLLLGQRGELIVNHYSFYSAFMTEEEFRLEVDGKAIGALPISQPLSEGDYIIFGGRRWQVVHVDMDRKVVGLAPAPAGKAPVFGGSGATVHGRVRQEMRAIYVSQEMPAFLDPDAARMLRAARAAYARYGLEHSRIIEHDGKVILFPWAGDDAMNTLVLILTKLGIKATRDGIAIEAGKLTRTELATRLSTLSAESSEPPRELAKGIANTSIAKYHPFLGPELLATDYASSRLDVGAALRIANDFRTELQAHGARG